jgi:hypothetical protein
MSKEANFISRWGHLIENFHASSLEFYESVERAIEYRGVPETHRIRVEHKEAGLASANRLYLRLHRGKFAFDICAAPFGNGFFVSWWLTEPPLPFGFVFTLAFFMLVVLAINIAFVAGFAIGSTFLGIGFAAFLGAALAVFGVPLLFWILGNGVRQGTIPGESTLLAMPLVGRLYEKIFAPPTYYAIDTALMFQQAVHSAVLEVMECMTANKGVRALSEAERKPIMKTFAASV